MFYFSRVCLFLHIIVQESGSRLSTVITIVVLGHEAANSGNGTVFPQAGDLSVGFDSVILECLQRDGLVGALDLLWLGEDLLFALLTSSSQTEDQVKGGLLLDVVITQGAAIFQLLSGKDKTLLIWRDSFLVLDLGLDVIDGVGWFDIKGDGLSSKSLDENLE